MFGLKNYYKREKLKIDTELFEYRMKMDNELHEYRKEIDAQIQELAVICARDRGQYEHVFHSSREKLTTEIAKLEAERDAKREIVNNDKITYERLLAEKDKEIERIHAMYKLLIGTKNCVTKK